MSEQQYELAFYGKLVEGSSLQETKAQVAQLFKTGVEQIERMFTGSRVVIRNKLDQETAKKYIIALKKRGAVCQIELMGQPGIAVNFDAVPEQAPQPSALFVSKEVPVSSEAPVSNEVTGTEIKNKPIEYEPSKSSSAKASMSVNGLPIVGDKVDEILRATHFDLAPVGVRLEDEKQKVVLELHALDNVSLAPAGSILLEQKEPIPVSVPDTSHIQLASKD